MGVQVVQGIVKLFNKTILRFLIVRELKDCVLKNLVLKYLLASLSYTQLTNKASPVVECPAPKNRIHCEIISLSESLFFWPFDTLLKSFDNVSVNK